MDTAGFNNSKLGSDSQDSDDLQPPAPPGLERPLIKFATKDTKLQKASPLTPLGVEQAKKRLKAFSIQKKTSLSPVPIPKGSGAATVFIGKASGVKSLPKPAPEPSPDEAKKPPKPPKPGVATESYIKTQKKTLAEIEDMKRKMELVELGIPLGLICPAPNSEWNKAMPTKAMPPIKTFLDENYKENAPPTHLSRRPQFVTIYRDKVDELIREGKKARAEGREFKFDYRKLLPDYDNPFQRKKDLQMMAEPELPKSELERKSRDKDKRRSDRYDSKRRSSHKSDDKHRRRDEKYKDKSKDKKSCKERDKSKEKKDTKHKDQDDKHKERDAKPAEKDIKSKERDKSKDDKKYKEIDVKTEEVTKETEKEADVNLKDFVVCDSWSDNDDKSKDSTPKPEEVKVAEKSTLYADIDVPIDPMKQLRENLLKKEKTSSPKPKLKRLNPDAVKFEVVEPDDDDDDDDVLDMFDERSSLEQFSKLKKDPEESSMDQLFDFDDAKDETFEGMADDTFLESVINEIKQEEIDEDSQDKGLVEYDESPPKEDLRNRSSVTPELDDRTRHLQSSRSDYSDGYKSTESGYKSMESGKMSNCDLETMVEERKRELERLEGSRKLDKYTEDSLDMWSFVLKVCQPMLFRHDRNKCYKETSNAPKLWYTENPKLCNCVKDRSVVYEELDVYKVKYLDTLYGSEQSPEMVEAESRGWYPSVQQWPTPPLQAASEWEAEDSQAEQHASTPQHHHLLDEEYQRFMATVRPDIGESKSETPLSTPSRREASKKKSTEPVEDKNSKRMKMTSEGWSQESDQEDERDKSHTALQDYIFEAVHFNPKQQTVEKKKEKRKRKHSSSTSMTDSSESEPKKRKKTQKKKDIKKSKLKDSKRRRVSKKNIKKLKEKQKKKKKAAKDEDSDIQELEREKKKKDKKLKKKKLLKQKKKTQKKKKSRARSSSSDNSDSEPEKKSKKKKKGDKKKKKKKSDAQEKQLFDVNILNNIKTERNSDEERNEMEFSPRKQKVTREIINVKELQNDFVGNSIQIKKEVEEDDKRKVSDIREDSQESQVEHAEKESSQDLKDEEETQSTPQLKPDESNNSQCSSQESVYSLKDQLVYEKDESHLRPSSQNSNYSFHDVMASGKFSKNKQEQVYGFDNNSRSQESDRLHEEDIRSQECEVRSHEHEMRSQEIESESQEYDRSREHDSRCQNVIRSQEHSYEYDQHSQEYEIHGIPSHIRDIPRPDSRSREHDSRSHEHDSRSHAYDSRSHDHDSRSHVHDSLNYEHESRGREHEALNNEHKILHDMPYKHDVMSNNDIDLQSHDVQTHVDEMDGHEYEQGNYEMYEQMAMAYQSDVANQRVSPPDGSRSRPIETVVRARSCGEIKCDWRAGAPLAPPAHTNRPSRWGLKPGEVNIVLTGGPPPPPPARVYRIQSLANRTDNNTTTGYDEAYMDTYGAADKLQYGDCFSTDTERRNITPLPSSLDDRINLALRTTVLGEVAKDADETEEREREKGILVTKSLAVESRAPKRVSFADGYKPGQDSDVEEPPVKKKKKSRRVGCAWPCPATHPDHVPLWDALPPPPPPPGSPPPPAQGPPPPTHLLRQGRLLPNLLQAPPHHMFGNNVKLESMNEQKFEVTSLGAFMPPEPPPGLLSFHNM